MLISGTLLLLSVEKVGAVKKSYGLSAAPYFTALPGGGLAGVTLRY